MNPSVLEEYETFCYSSELWVFVVTGSKGLNTESNRAAYNKVATGQSFYNLAHVGNCYTTCCWNLDMHKKCKVRTSSLPLIGIALFNKYFVFLTKMLKKPFSVSPKMVFSDGCQRTLGIAVGLN